MTATSCITTDDIREHLQEDYSPGQLIDMIIEMSDARQLHKFKLGIVKLQQRGRIDVKLDKLLRRLDEDSISMDDVEVTLSEVLSR